MSIGSRLRRLRLARGMTQKELANERYTHAYVSSIESGRRRPSREAAEHFASRLGVDVDELMSGRPADLRARLALRLHDVMLALASGAIDGVEHELAAIVRHANRHAVPIIEAGAELGFGMLLERRGRPREALGHHQRAEALFDAGPAGATADVVAGKASCFAALGELRYAIYLLEGSLRQFELRGIRDPDALTRLYASLVPCYVQAGFYERAAKSAEDLDRLAVTAADPITISRLYADVARLHLAEGRTQEGERSLQRASDALRMLVVEGVRGHACLARGFVASRAGHVDDARRFLDQAVQIFERSGEDDSVARALNELARVERLGGRTERARALLERSIAILDGRDSPALAWAHRELGVTLSASHPDAAERHLRTAIELYAEGPGEDLAAAYRSLGEHLEAGGQTEAAADAYRMAILGLEPQP